MIFTAIEPNLIRSIRPGPTLSPAPASQMTTGATSHVSFSALLEQGIHHVDALQHSASAQQRAIDLGLSDDLTNTVLAGQKASIAFSAMVQVRNKLTQALDDIVSMPV